MLKGRSLAFKWSYQFNNIFLVLFIHRPYNTLCYKHDNDTTWICQTQFWKKNSLKNKTKKKQVKKPSNNSKQRHALCHIKVLHTGKTCNISSYHTAAILHACDLLGNIEYSRRNISLCTHSSVSAFNSSCVTSLDW